MKYLVVLGDGMPDYKIPELGNKTPLEKAAKPNMDLLCSKGITGLVKTTCDNLRPDSDVANLTVLGYDPNVVYTGRSPLEAASIGIKMKDNEISLRTNLVTLSEEENYEDKTMIDYSSDEISCEEASILIKHVNENLKTEEIFHSIWHSINNSTAFPSVGKCESQLFLIYPFPTRYNRHENYRHDTPFLFCNQQPDYR